MGLVVLAVSMLYGIHPMRLFRRIHKMSIDDAMEQALAANPKLGGHNIGSTGV